MVRQFAWMAGWQRLLPTTDEASAATVRPKAAAKFWLPDWLLHHRNLTFDYGYTPRGSVNDRSAPRDSLLPTCAVSHQRRASNPCDYIDSVTNRSARMR